MSNLDICVCTYNKLEYTKQFIECVERHTKIDHKYIIIDDGSTDETYQFLESLSKDKFIIDRNENNEGYLLSMNKALSKTTADFICVINNDVLISKSCLDNLIDFIELKKIWAASPRIIFGDDIYNKETDWYDFVEKRSNELILDEAKEGFLYGCLFVMSRECYEIIGGFDERFVPFWFEDNDYILRLKEVNHDPWISFGSFAFHYVNTSLVQNEHLNEIWVKNLGKFRKKWSISDTVENFDIPL